MGKLIQKCILLLLIVMGLFSGCTAPANNSEPQNSEKPKTSTANAAEQQPVSKEELDAQLAKQPLTIIHTSYAVQSNKYKTPYPSMLQAVIQNNSGKDIKHAVIAFVAWDENGLPVKIAEKNDFTGGAYIKRIHCNNIHLLSGRTNRESLILKKNNTIHTFKAIVVSYETLEGKRWNNPYYAMFCTLYKEKKLQ